MLVLLLLTCHLLVLFFDVNVVISCVQQGVPHVDRNRVPAERRSSLRSAFDARPPDGVCVCVCDKIQTFSWTDGCCSSFHNDHSHLKTES